MEPGNMPLITVPPRREWRLARRSAFIEETLAVLRQRPAALMSFEQVYERLQLKNVRYLNLQDVPTDRIVGSVGRYTDFTRAFLPRGEHLRSRWENIEKMVEARRRLPPVELYKVGEAFFVRDGNHRVSVARQRRMVAIEALVWEYEAPVPLQPDSDIDQLLCDAAREAFLERTRIDSLCPNVHLELTHPEGYDALLREMAQVRAALSRMEGRELDPEEATTFWCEIRYLPIVEIIRQRAILQYFPGRTETDLYLWLCSNRSELEESHQQHVMMEEAADDLTRRFGSNLPGIRQVRKAGKWMVGAIAEWTRDLRKTWRAGRKHR